MWICKCCFKGCSDWGCDPPTCYCCHWGLKQPMLSEQKSPNSDNSIISWQPFCNSANHTLNNYDHQHYCNHQAKLNLLATALREANPAILAVALTESRPDLLKVNFLSIFETSTRVLALNIQKPIFWSLRRSKDLLKSSYLIFAPQIWYFIQIKAHPPPDCHWRKPRLKVSLSLDFSNLDIIFDSRLPWLTPLKKTSLWLSPQLKLFSAWKYLKKNIQRLNCQIIGSVAGCPTLLKEKWNAKLFKRCEILRMK